MIIFVGVEQRATSKFLRANMASIRFLSSMRPCVYNERSSLREALSAVRANVGFFFRVYSDVRLQYRTGGKFLAAKLTRVRLQARV